MKEVSYSEFSSICKNASRNWKGVILHHTSSPTARSYQGIKTWEGIRNYHMNVRKFSDIGYHCGVSPDGKLRVLRRRDSGGDKGYMNSFGAHCVNYNGTHAGFCLLGNFNEEDPYANYYGVIVDAISIFLQARGLKANNLYFHRSFANTDCPGYKLNLSAVRNDVTQRMCTNEIIPDEDPRPETPLLAVVVGSLIIPCAPKLWQSQLYVMPEPFCAAMGVPVPDIHIHESGYALATSIMAKIDDWQLFYRGPESGIPYHRWYPKHISWLA